MRVAFAIVCSFISILTFSQPIFRNPSFESNEPPRYDRVPPQWLTNLLNCGGRSTPDLQPGEYGVSFPPHHGSTYTGLVARADNTAEAVFQVLDSPLRVGSCYAFTIHLARSDYYDGFVYINPLRLEIWGGSDDCQRTELLWRSPVIDNTTWQPYEVKFTPSANHSNIIFLATGYNGNVLIDDIVGEKILNTGWSPSVAAHSICEGETLQLDIYRDNAQAYAWNTGETTSAITVSAAGSYTATVDFGMCAFTSSFAVTLKKKPQLSVGKDTVLYFGNDHYQMMATGSPAEASLVWNTGEKTQGIVAHKAGQYWASLSNECGIVTDTINVDFLDLLVPNIVTDNDDGKNDKFQIDGVEPGTYGISIYNRWGDLIFSSSSYQNNWPVNNVAPAVYYYILHNRRNANAPLRGVIHLITR